MCLCVYSRACGDEVVKESGGEQGEKKKKIKRKARKEVLLGRLRERRAIRTDPYPPTRQFFHNVWKKLPIGANRKADHPKFGLNLASGDAFTLWTALSVFGLPAAPHQVLRRA